MRLLSTLLSLVGLAAVILQLVVRLYNREREPRTSLRRRAFLQGEDWHDNSLRIWSAARSRATAMKTQPEDAMRMWPDRRVVRTLQSATLGMLLAASAATSQPQ